MKTVQITGKFPTRNLGLASGVLLSLLIMPFSLFGQADPISETLIEKVSQQPQTMPAKNSGMRLAKKPKNQILEVFENEGGIVIVDENGPRRLITPKSLLNSSHFEIRLEKPEEEKVAQEFEPEKRVPTLDERVKAQKLLFEANEAFFNGDLKRTWSLIDQAEQLDPDNFRIKSMKGSLLYRLGSEDLAQSLWEESLAINPDQPEIRKLLESSKAKM